MRHRVNKATSGEMETPVPTPAGTARRTVLLGSFIAAVAALGPPPAAGNAVGVPVSASTDASTAPLFTDPKSLSRRSFYDTIGMSHGIRVETFGAIFDGVADDGPALAQALEAAAKFGVPIVFPAGKVLGINNPVRIPAGTTIFTNGSRLRSMRATGGHNVYISSNVSIFGGLKLITTGANTRGVRFDGVSNVSIDYLTVESDVPLAGAGDPMDTAILITGSSKIRIGEVHVKDYDYQIRVDGSSDVTFDSLSMEGYVRGLYLLDAQNFTVNRGVAKTASANAQASPGHNAILMEASAQDATRDIRINNFSGRDAGEHGFRLGGAFRIKHIWFDGCEARNTGRCGFKVLGGKVGADKYHENIYFNNCLVVDCGQNNEASAAFMLQCVRNVTVTSPRVRKKNKPYSVVCGFNIQAAEDVEIISPNVRDTMSIGYYVGFILGNCDGINLRGGSFISFSGDGVRILATNRQFRNINITGMPTINVPGYVMNVSKSGATISPPNHLEWQSASAGQLHPSSDLREFNIRVLAPFFSASAVPIRHGSRWTNSATGVIHYRKSGAWVPL